MKKILTILLIIAILLATSACVDHESVSNDVKDESISLIVIQTHRSNQPIFGLHSGDESIFDYSLLTMVQRVLNNNGNVMIVRSDGFPSLIFSKSYLNLTEEETKKAKEEIISVIEDNNAEHEGSDIIGAINLSIKLSKGLSGKKYIYIQDNFLQTNAPKYLDYLLEPTDDFSDYLSTNCLSPTNATFILEGIGETVYPQQELSASSKEKLRDIVQSTLDKLGEGTVVFTQKCYLRRKRMRNDLIFYYGKIYKKLYSFSVIEKREEYVVAQDMRTRLYYLIQTSDNETVGAPIPLYKASDKIKTIVSLNIHIK